MKFLKGLLLAILVFVLFVSSIFLLILVPVKNAVGKNSIKDMVINLEIEKMVAEDPEVKKSFDEMFEPIFKETEEFGIDEDVIVKIIDSKEVKELMGDVTANIVDFVLTGENHKLITTGNMQELVSSAIDDINESGIYEISEKDKNEVLDVVGKYAEEVQEYIPDTKMIESSFNEEDMKALNLVRFILGNTLVTYLLVIWTISILGIFALKYKEAKWIKWSAIPVLVSSIISCITFGILTIANNMYLKADFSYISDIFNKSITFGIILSGIIAILMIAILIVYHVVSKNKIKKVSV